MTLPTNTLVQLERIENKLDEALRLLNKYYGFLPIYRPEGESENPSLKMRRENFHSEKLTSLVQPVKG
jgi:hypothetical protein